MTSKPPHIIVVGAGVVGASLAYHLVRQNARVTLLDNATQPAGNATANSFAWITAGHGASETYLNLRQAAIADWHRVENEFNGRFNINWSGSLRWFDDPTATAQVAQDLLNFDCPVRLIPPQQIRLLEPNLKRVPAQALFSTDDGALDPTRATALLVAAAREAGATIQLRHEVLSFMANDSRITGVVTATGKITADLVVLTAGTRAASLCQSLDLALPLDESPAILTSFRTRGRFVHRVVSNPCMEIRAASTTLTVAADEYVDESMENNPQAIAKRTLLRIKEHWHGTEHVSLAGVAVGRRPMPRDGLPIIGRTTRVDGLYLSVMHAGVTLAAIAGRLAAREIVSQQGDVLLAPYRLERFK